MLSTVALCLLVAAAEATSPIGPGSPGEEVVPLPGGFQDTDNENANRQALAAVELMNEGLEGDAAMFRLSHIIEMKHQVVAGINYDMTVLVSETACPRTKVVDFTTAAKCDLKVGGDKMRCALRLYVPLPIPDLPSKSQLTKSECIKFQIF